MSLAENLNILSSILFGVGFGFLLWQRWQLALTAFSVAGGVLVLIGSGMIRNVELEIAQPDQECAP